MYRMEATTDSARPPDVLRLIAHALRWRLLRELSHSDRRVRELARSLGEPQPLVSYHLRHLRATGLVEARRSSFDGRDTYYTLDLARCGELLADAGAALHPALRLAPAQTAPRRGRRPTRVLFLCTGNSARSQIAEALLRKLSDGAVQAFSAGSRPKGLHPNAVRVMRTAHGIDISAQRPKHLGTFGRRRFDWVISLCDRVREVCPEFPGEPQTVHWSIADPAAEPGGDEETYPAFERTAAELETRIGFLLSTVNTPTEVPS
jgi:ArsR family transcriptional regulator, arsenate/arsenite/antimonite-responsive transcriptional repressor / arsenate reductase (thioredoxin)